MWLSLLSTSSMWNISTLFWGPSGICVYSPRATPSVNKPHISSWPQNNLYQYLKSLESRFRFVCRPFGSINSNCAVWMVTKTVLIGISRIVCMHSDMCNDGIYLLPNLVGNNYLNKEKSTSSGFGCLSLGKFRLFWRKLQV